jgi:hypothetical protein
LRPTSWEWKAATGADAFSRGRCSQALAPSQVRIWSARPIRKPSRERRSHYFLPATDKTVRWDYFSRSLKPLVEIDSGDYVTIEALTRHANDDYERMIKGDPGVESVFLRTKDKKNVNRRGAGPIRRPSRPRS